MVALLLILLATDGERRPTHVSFTAPEGCPLIDRYRSELTFRSDRIELVGDEASATAHVVVTITKARRFEGLLVVKTSNGKSVTKRVAGPKCESVTAALSLAAALVLDPEAKAGALPETLVPLPQGFGSVYAIYPEAPMYQNVASTSIELALVGSATESEVLGLSLPLP